MASNNVTAQVIVDTIEETFEGEMLEFLASFIDYCNDRTMWGVPRKCRPLDSDIDISFGILTVRVSDAAIECDYSAECLYTVEEELMNEDNQYLVYVTPYAYDEECNEMLPCICISLPFKVTEPKELKKLCDYIGVEFQPSYFN